MIYSEEIRDLFTVDDSYHLCHCISADFALGAGIAVEFNRRFNMRNELRSLYPNYLIHYINDFIDGDCILHSKVFNLITKERCYQKPTYTSLANALRIMKNTCLISGIKKIAMPTIGCGLDRLVWERVSYIIKDVFADTDIEILVCMRDE